MKDKVVSSNSHVKDKKTEVEDHHMISSTSNKTKSVTTSNDSLKSRTSNVNAVCATYGKCVFNSNHDDYVSKFLKDVNARTKKPNVVPISTRKPKSQANKSVATPHKKTVASESTITNSKSYYRMLYKKTNKAWKCPCLFILVIQLKVKGGNDTIQTIADDRKPKPRSNNQTSRSLPVSKSSRVTITVVPKADHSKSSSSFSDSKQFVCSICHKCVFNANHDACITKLLKKVNSRAKIQSHKTRNSNKPVDQKSHSQKPGRQIFIGHRFSPNKTSAVYEKTSPRSDLRWKPIGRIFKSVGLRWIPTGKLFDSCTSKVDSELPHGLNVDTPNIHECKQTLDVSAGTSIIVQKEQGLNLSAGTLCNVNKENLRVWLLKKMISETIINVDSQMMIQKNDFKPRTTMSTEVHQAVDTVTTSNELDVLFSPLFDEYFNGENQVVLKSSAVTTTDASNKRQQQPDSTLSTSTLATTVIANGNFDL
ncbi:hypothetical protein Tco_1240302 [Tanacetum coccineum]